MKEADNLVLVDILGKEEVLFSGNYSCPDCNISMEEFKMKRLVSAILVLVLVLALCPVAFAVREQTGGSQTGDTARGSLILWGVLMAVSLVAIIVLAIRRKKHTR